MTNRGRGAWLAVFTALTTAPAAGQTVRAPVTRDTWFSNVGAEADGNNGGAARLKLKSNQEMSLVDLDPKPLQGRVVQSATLHLRSAGAPRLLRVTVGGFGAEWVEGTGSGYQPQAGSSTHNHRKHPDVPWTRAGGDLCAVMIGGGGTTWRMADASPPDPEGWQTVAVDPVVVAGRVAGMSAGFLLFDDTGSEWTRQGETFTPHHMPNRFVYSREQSNSAPYFTIELGPEDHAPPAAPGDVRGDGVADALPAGEARVSWTTPADSGPAGTIGFFVTVNGAPAPRDLIPLAGPSGGRVRMHLRDLDLKPGAEVALTVRAVDGSGNVGPPATALVRVSATTAPPLPATALAPFSGRGPLPRLGPAEVAVVDELDKMSSATGVLIPDPPDGYLSANHLWDASTRLVRLAAAKNEFVAFQVLVRGDARKVRPSLTFEGPGPLAATFGRCQAVETTQGPLPDPVVPIDAAGPDSAFQNSSLYCEVYVPHSARAGTHRGRLTLKSGADALALNVDLRVWDFTLPDTLSFLPEMNCYGLPSDERDYYRLAHAHRTVLNRVPYHQNGAIEDGCAPVRDGTTLDWSAWDRRFGPYLDGSAFADLPRKGVPIECFYLPLHENWPTPMEGNYNGDYWADRAFPPSYRAAFVSAARQFAEHLNAKHWDGTLFQCFLNGKNDFKAKGWSRGSSPWLLDEPAHWQDYWALRYFGAAFHEGINQARGPARLVFRADVSRPQWQRDAFDGLLDYNVVGGALRRYHRLVMDRKEANGEIVLEYGSTNPIEEPNVQPVGWCLDAWSLGTDGVLPWQTVGTADSWRRADPLALFYPGRDGGGPVASLRLKAYRRGQQDVEYLTLLAQTTGAPRWAVGRRVRADLHLEPERRQAGGEDAGLVHYDRLRPDRLWDLRMRVGAALDRARPAPKRTLVDLRTPPRDPSRLPPGLASPLDRDR